MAVYTPLDYVIALAILLVIMWLSSKYLFAKLTLDRYFAYAMAPVIVFSIAIRVLADAGVYEKNGLWNVTPGIYITGSIFGVGLLILGKIVEGKKDIPYWKAAIAFGTPPAAYFSTLLFLEMQNPLLSLQPILLALILTYAIYIASNFTQPTRMFREKVNFIIIFSHMLDGSATYIGIDKYGFYEEHILPEIFINTFGTAFIMIPLKIVVVLSALYLLDKWKEEEEGSDLYYKMVKFVFFIFGFGPGTRDSLLLAF